MSTRRQRAASRANGQKSQGPVTTEGKNKSRFNALKHGIDAKQQVMFTESAEDLAELAAEYHELHKPANADERFLVDTLINNDGASAASAAWKPTSGDPLITFSSRSTPKSKRLISATPSLTVGPSSNASNAS